MHNYASDGYCPSRSRQHPPARSHSSAHKRTHPCAHRARADPPTRLLALSLSSPLLPLFPTTMCPQSQGRFLCPQSQGRFLCPQSQGRFLLILTSICRCRASNPSALIGNPSFSKARQSVCHPSVCPSSTGNSTPIFSHPSASHPRQCSSCPSSTSICPPSTCHWRPSSPILAASVQG